MQKIEDRLQQLQQDQGIFATRVKQELEAVIARIGIIEAALRCREEAIQEAFDSSHHPSPITHQPIHILKGF